MSQVHNVTHVPVHSPISGFWAHDRNDEVLERIYIGRRFRNDTERLEKLLAGFAYMRWRESHHPGAHRRGAMMLIRTGGTPERDVEPNEPSALL
jgi:hypothetical protein